MTSLNPTEAGASVSTALTLLLASSLLLLFPPLRTMLGLGKNHFPVRGRLIVVTGGSQGMGLSVAHELSSRGASVVIIARDQSKLDAALQSVQSRAVDPDAQQFLSVSADLTDPKAVEAAFARIAEWAGGRAPDVVWTCAGAAQCGLLAELGTDVFEAQMKTNYLSALYTAHAAIKLMVSHPQPTSSPKRHIVFTSSVLAFVGLTGYTPYAPAKAALKALAECLRQECVLYDIDVHCCFPATIFSPGFENEQKTKPEVTKMLEEGDDGQTPEEVAKKCIKGLERGETWVVTSIIGQAMRGVGWGGVPRNWVLWDTLVSWIVCVVWVVVGWDMRRKVSKWGAQNGYGSAVKKGV
ncbi:putative 3-ketosphinganine reductase [Kalaharituber pfeilii]|nr:putative 3-ketosphinganine reductase [Kalaharituber pfeilii]